MAQHQAAIIQRPGQPLEVVQRTTPAPGPDEVLISVKAVALNPIDVHQRAVGFHIDAFPSVVGSDVAGVVAAVGSSAPSSLKVGARVVAFAPCFFKLGAPDYGALQKQVLVTVRSVTELPDSLSFNEASLLPMAITTTWSAIYTFGMPFDTRLSASEKKGMLVWGGASSVGSAMVQVAKSLGFVVYATASPKNHDFLAKLGADRLFDYRADGVEAQIVAAAAADGLTISRGYDAVGGLASLLEIVPQTKGAEDAIVASAPLLRPGHATKEGVTLKFVSAPEGDQQRGDHMSFIYRTWLPQALADGTFVPSPSVKVIEGGLDGANAGLDELQKGVSGVKLVLEL